MNSENSAHSKPVPLDCALGELETLEGNNRDSWLNSFVKCSCGCRRKVKNCKRYIETESWEMPWIKYEVCICPRCGNDMEENP